MLLHFAFAYDEAIRGDLMKGFSVCSYHPFIYFLPIYVMFQIKYGLNLK
jgi:hypothetical protein